MRPKEQIVGFSKFRFDETETPILVKTASSPPSQPTPARRSTTVRTDSRPTPPPRPAAFSSASTSNHLQGNLRSYTNQNDTSPTVTRF
uniref:Uncharacterized protein n=1 Tax=Caenorhabditis japonica TaxID=281687 RepID=A0A8R1EWV4_CAEJA